LALETKTNQAFNFDQKLNYKSLRLLAIAICEIKVIYSMK